MTADPLAGDDDHYDDDDDDDDNDDDDDDDQFEHSIETFLPKLLEGLGHIAFIFRSSFHCTISSWYFHSKCTAITTAALR